MPKSILILLFLFDLNVYSQKIPTEYRFDNFVISNQKRLDINTEKKIITFSNSNDNSYSLSIDNSTKKATLRLNNIKYNVEFKIEQTVYNENDLQYLVPIKYYELNPSIYPEKVDDTRIKIKNKKKQKQIYVIKNNPLQTKRVYYFKKNDSKEIIGDYAIKKSLSEKYNIDFNPNEHLTKIKVYIMNDKIFESEIEKIRIINLLFKFDLDESLYSKEKIYFTE